MNPDLGHLIQLQRLESELKRVEAEIAETPRLKAEMDGVLAEERAKLEVARERLHASQKDRRQHEADLQDLETKRSKYKGQLMEVKTNKEYTAMLHEIEAVERDIRAREDLILQDMENAESLSAEVKQEEGLLKSAEERHRKEASALDARSVDLGGTAKALKAERDQVAEAISPDVLELFHRVAKLRGVAVAEVKDAMCQVCHLKLRLQMWYELRHNEEIAQCPACNRILFYEPAPASVEP